MLRASNLSPVFFALVFLALVFGGAPELARAQTILFELHGDTPGDRLGAEVASGGDIDGDGLADLLLTMAGSDAPGVNAGRVLLVSGGTGAVLRNFDGWHEEQSFGSAIAFVGDVDGDGTEDILIGARWDDTQGYEAGAAYLYSGATGDLLLPLYTSYTGGWFGGGAAGLGDIDGDGVPDLAVSGSRLDGAVNDCGVVLAFSGATGAVLHAWEGDSSNDHFGANLVSIGDLDLDGVPDLAISAYGDSVTGDRTGSVQVFSGADGSLLPRVDGTIPIGLLGLSLTASATSTGCQTSPPADRTPTARIRARATCAPGRGPAVRCSTNSSGRASSTASAPSSPVGRISTGTGSPTS